MIAVYLDGAIGWAKEDAGIYTGFYEIITVKESLSNPKPDFPDFLKNANFTKEKQLWEKQPYFNK
jgi:hypothetical protein